MKNDVWMGLTLLVRLCALFHNRSMAREVIVEIENKNVYCQNNTPAFLVDYVAFLF